MSIRRPCSLASRLSPRSWSRWDPPPRRQVTRRATPTSAPPRPPSRGSGSPCARSTPRVSRHPRWARSTWPSPRGRGRRRGPRAAPGGSARRQPWPRPRTACFRSTSPRRRRQPRRRPGERCGASPTAAEDKGVRIGEKAAARDDREPRVTTAATTRRHLRKPDEAGVLAAARRAAPWPGLARLRRPAGPHPAGRARRPRPARPAAPTPRTTRRCWRLGSPRSDPRPADEAATARFFAFNPPVMYRDAPCATC